MEVILAYMAGLLTAGAALHFYVMRPTQRSLVSEQDRNSDLLNRVSARSLEQYAFLAGNAYPSPTDDDGVEYLYDETGLIMGEADRDDSG